MNTEIKKIKNSTWLIPGPTNIGIIEDKEEVILIDSGNDKESGRKILKILKEKGWSLKSIINTHSNADHIGGNNYLQRMTGCEIWTSRGEAGFINMPLIEGSFLWGGYPFKELQSKFFKAKPSQVTKFIDENKSCRQFKIISLPGHFFDQIGVLTADNVFFPGDSIFGNNILLKYKIPYIYDVDAFRKSIEKIKNIKADYFVPSHGEIVNDVQQLAEININKSVEIEESIKNIIKIKKSFEDILKEISDLYGINLDHGQYVLVGNTVRSFLSFLYNNGKAEYSFNKNRMYWKLI